MQFQVRRAVGAILLPVDNSEKIAQCYRKKSLVPNNYAVPSPVQQYVYSISYTLASHKKMNGNVTNPDEVRSVWADHFEKLATPQDDAVFNDKFRSEIDSSVAAIKVISTYLAQETTDPFSADEVRSAVSRLKTKKASDLCAEHIILRACCLTPVLVMLFNSILELSYIPTSFKEGMVVPVPKKGKDHRLTDNYRGITITSIIGKVLEHAIQHRLRNQIEHKQSIQQRGFTKGSSSTNAALILMKPLQKQKIITESSLLLHLMPRKHLT